MSSRLALQVNAIVGMVSLITAGAMMWLVLTRPAEVTSAIANHEYGVIATALASQLSGWLQALLRFI